MAESYSRITKEAILENIPKKKCCQRIRQDALDLAAITDADLRAEKISSAPEHFRCGTCPASFAAGLFVSFGGRAGCGRNNFDSSWRLYEIRPTGQPAFAVYQKQQ